MLRLLVPAFMMASVALSATATADTHDPVPLDVSGDCITLTLVSTDAEQPDVDIYISKAEPLLNYDGGNDPDALQRHLDEVVLYVLAYVGETHADFEDGGTVMVEVIFPRNTDLGTDGVRFSILAEVANCTP